MVDICDRCRQCTSSMGKVSDLFVSFWPLLWIFSNVFWSLTRRRSEDGYTALRNQALFFQIVCLSLLYYIGHISPLYSPPVSVQHIFLYSIYVYTIQRVASLRHLDCLVQDCLIPLLTHLGYCSLALSSHSTQACFLLSWSRSQWFLLIFVNQMTPLNSRRDSAKSR